MSRKVASLTDVLMRTLGALVAVTGSVTLGLLLWSVWSAWTAALPSTLMREISPAGAAPLATRCDFGRTSTVLPGSRVAAEATSMHDKLVEHAALQNELVRIVYTL